VSVEILGGSAVILEQVKGPKTSLRQYSGMLIEGSQSGQSKDAWGEQGVKGPSTLKTCERLEKN